MNYLTKKIVYVCCEALIAIKDFSKSVDLEAHLSHISINFLFYKLT